MSPLVGAFGQGQGSGRKPRVGALQAGRDLDRAEAAGGWAAWTERR